MLELYQSESCPECGEVRRKLAANEATYIVRTVPMDRARRERVVEAGGRPDIPLLLDPDRGRTTYDADEIVLQLGTEDEFNRLVDERGEPGLAHLYQREGEPESDRARRLLDAAGLDYILHPVRRGAAEDVPRLLEPDGGPARIGVAAIEDWARGFKLRG
jgi:glutaredoxin